MGKTRGWAVTAAALAVALGGCTHLVHQEDNVHYDPTALEARVSTVEGDVASVRNDLDALRSSMTNLERMMGAHVDDDDMHGVMHVALPVHFDFNVADIRAVDRPILDAFAAGIRSTFPDAVITVAGYADGAGSVARNRVLTQERADNVRDYLVSQGLNADNLRSVAMGQARQVNPGAQGPGQSGIENRRVTFSVDYSGSTN